MKAQRLLLVFALGLGLTLALFWTLGGRTNTARADVLCVTPGGSGECYSSIQAAVDAAQDGDTVRVAQGVYSETIIITKSVTLEGGWNGDFTARDWDTYVTTIDAHRNGPVVWVKAPVTPTIDGFVITGGDDSASHLGWGGGIKVYRPGGISTAGYVVIRHNVITDNIACIGNGCQGYGGGIMLYYATALIEGNTIISNAAQINGNGSGGGGGIKVWNSSAVISGNVIISNTAVYTTVSPAVGKGGGVDTDYANSDTVLRNNEIRGNVAAIGSDGRGGGVYGSPAELYDNRILSNTASVNGDGYGGGLYADYAVTAFDNLIQGNVASQNGDGSGGGIWAQYLKWAERNTIVDNVATRGGGIYYTAYPHAITLYDNLIARNRATGSSSATPPDGGGGVLSYADDLEIAHNTIVSNTAASSYGGGVLINQGTQYAVHDNLVVSNTALAAGGIGVYTATGEIFDNQIVSNTALIGGGMYLFGAAQPALDGNVVLSNTASGFWGAAGGGVMVSIDAGLPITLTNHIIARNAAGSYGRGGGLLCWRGDCALINNTIVDNDRGDYDEGVILGNSSYAGTYTLTNNIIAGHSTGVRLVTGTATLDYNDYYDNGTNVSGATWGTHHRTDDPQFADRAAADYHLTLTSPLVDQGDGSVAPTHDFEGDPRPRGGGVDIGADEAYPPEVYVSANVGSDATGEGTPDKPYASVTKGLAEVRSGGAVYVAQGDYTERITVTRGVALLGGYDESDWSRDIAVYTSTLDGQGSGTVVVIFAEGISVTVEGFEITGGEANIYGAGGGLLAVDASAVTVRYNTIHGNHAADSGGGLFIDEGPESLVEANRIYDNRADSTGFMGGGGGIIVGNPSRIINNLIYSNTASRGGDGVQLFAYGQEEIQFLHNTVVDNGGASGVGVQVSGPTVEMYNNLLVGHGTAISGTQATWDYNGLYDNGARYAAGLSAGANDVSGDPHFADRVGQDYHIGPGSAMAGRGSDVGVTADFDGATRPAPAGTVPDLGAYEVAQRRIYLPLVMRGQ